MTLSHPIAGIIILLAGLALWCVDLNRYNQPWLHYASDLALAFVSSFATLLFVFLAAAYGFYWLATLDLPDIAILIITAVDITAVYIMWRYFPRWIFRVLMILGAIVLTTYFGMLLEDPNVQKSMEQQNEIICSAVRAQEARGEKSPFHNACHQPETNP